MVAASTTRQELISWHASDLRRRSSGLVPELDGVVSEVGKIIQSYLRRSMTSEDGVVSLTPNSALAMRDLDRQYASALRSSGYHEATGTFVGNFSDQIDHFRTMYAKMQEDLPLPDMPLTKDDGELLATRAALSLAALESSTMEIVASLRQSSALILGQAPLDQIVEHVDSIVGRTSGVERLARDLEMTFFRSVSSLVYRNLEESGLRPLYSYVGLQSQSSRPFCKTMLSSDPISHASVNVLDNGKTPSPFDNAGGPGCSHFWWISGLEGA